jgi:hypothetical protein
MSAAGAKKRPRSEGEPATAGLCSDAPLNAASPHFTASTDSRRGPNWMASAFQCLFCARYHFYRGDPLMPMGFQAPSASLSGAQNDAASSFLRNSDKGVPLGANEAISDPLRKPASTDFPTDEGARQSINYARYM